MNSSRDRKAPRDIQAEGDLPRVDAILTREEVAGWLKLNPRQVERLGVPCLVLGRKTVRYVAGDVRIWLAAHRRGGAS